MYHQTVKRDKGVTGIDNMENFKKKGTINRKY